MRLIALAPPGLGRLLAGELQAAGVPRVSSVEHGQRAELVPFEAAEIPTLRLAERLLAEVGRAEGTPPLRALVRRLWDPAGVQAALTSLGPARRGARRFRVVVQVRSERRFRRTELRDELVRAVLRDHPGWRPGEPARIELWALQTADGFRSGLVLGRRRRREVERPGALHPAVAAAMVRLAGAGPLLDPCCGTGTVLAEARAAGMAALGSDRSWEAVSTARANLRDVPLFIADAVRLPLASDAVAAVATNPPYGRRHPVEDDRWLGRLVAECWRVVAPGGRVVLLYPDTRALTSALRPLRRRLAGRHPVRLRGLATVIWVLDR